MAAYAMESVERSSRSKVAHTNIILNELHVVLDHERYLRASWIGCNRNDELVSYWSIVEG